PDVRIIFEFPKEAPCVVTAVADVDVNARRFWLISKILVLPARVRVPEIAISAVVVAPGLLVLFNHTFPKTPVPSPEMVCVDEPCKRILPVPVCTAAL